jgi:hypothetical protein
MIVKIDKKLPHFDGYATERTRGLYNVGVEDGQHFRLEVDVPVEEKDWQIGVVVGPSGSGKTSIAEALEKKGFFEWHAHWPQDTPIIETLGEDDYAKATAALAAVGLGSVPSWLRPRQVLSNGEGFRADLAQLLRGGAGDLQLNVPTSVYIDEFTSVLDRQVAKVGSGAFAKAWRKQNLGRIILITPHYDILDWVQPDWWLDTADGLDEFDADRGVVVARKGDFPASGHFARHPRNWVVTLEC